MRRFLLAILSLVPVVALAQSAPHRPLHYGPGSHQRRLVETRRSLTSRPAVAAPDKLTVFIGGTRGFYDLANPAIANRLIATKRIGLYQHAVAMNALSPSQLSAILTLWAPTGVNPTGGGQGMAEMTLGGSSGTPTSGTNAATVWGPAGRYPVEIVTGPVCGCATGTYTAPVGSANPGHVYTGWPQPSDAKAVETAISQAFGYGVKNAAAGFTPNGGKEDLDDRFATSGFWEPTRAMIRFGGGGSVDTPPSYLWNREPAYRANIAQQIAWINSQRLRSVVIVSPFSLVADGHGNTGPSAYDANLLENTQRLYRYLQSAGALPTQWVVENYAAPQFSAATANFADGSPEGLDTVALWLANAAATSHQDHPRRRRPALFRHPA